MADFTLSQSFRSSGVSSVKKVIASPPNFEVKLSISTSLDHPSLSPSPSSTRVNALKLVSFGFPQKFCRFFRDLFACSLSSRWVEAVEKFEKVDCRRSGLLAGDSA